MYLKVLVFRFWWVWEIGKKNWEIWKFGKLGNLKVWEIGKKNVVVGFFSGIFGIFGAWCFAFSGILGISEWCFLSVVFGVLRVDIR